MGEHLFCGTKKMKRVAENAGIGAQTVGLGLIGISMLPETTFIIIL